MNKKSKYTIITNLNEAKEIWERFSPHQTIDDEWDFRYIFFKHLNYELSFVVEFEGDRMIGLLPLQKNKTNGLMPPYAPQSKKPFLEVFGGDDTDDNKCFTKTNPSNLLAFVKHLETPAYLAPLDESFSTYAKFYDNKYYLPLTNYKSYEDFLHEKWSSSSRKKALQQVRKIYREHTIEILENNYEDIALLVALNKQRFGNESSFVYPYRKQIFEDLTKQFNVVMMTVVIDGKKAAVSYGIHYKNIYVGMNAGINTDIPDLAKFLTFLQIDKAIALGCDSYDAGKGDSGWKEQFHFNKTPQYMLTLDSKETLLTHRTKKIRRMTT